ncbi:MAG: hypothetical protein GY788_10275, partial [bacterium]|nr:hypothetical protein [bacterium]
MNHPLSGLLHTHQQSRKPHGFPVAAAVFAGVTAGIDSIVILLAGAVCYFLFFAGATSDLGTYSAAICFVWIVTALLFHLAGLYHFRAIIRPAAFFDRFVAAFLGAFLFLAASFSINDTNTLSTQWI